MLREETKTNTQLVALILAMTVLASCGRIHVHRQSGDPSTTLELRLAGSAPSPGSTEAHVGGESAPIFLMPEILVSRADIRDVVVEDSRWGYRIFLRFSEAAGQRLQAVTGSNVGRRLAVVVDGSVLIAPELAGAIGETVVIEGGYTKERALALARGLAP